MEKHKFYTGEEGRLGSIIIILNCNPTRPRYLMYFYPLLQSLYSFRNAFENRIRNEAAQWHPVSVLQMK